MNRRTLVVALVVSLSACGGGQSPTAPQPPPATLAVLNVGGAYTGNFTLESAPAVGTTTVSQAGTHIDFSPLVIVSGSDSVSFPLGGATLTGSTFTGTFNYVSSGCGAITGTTDGSFSGDNLLLHIALSPATCPHSDIRSTLSRGAPGGPPAPPPPT
jgi:hypothetical protein